MRSHLRRFLFIIPIICTAFISPGEADKVEYYYSFRSLRESSPPRELKIIRAENIRSNKSMLEFGILITYKNRSARSIKIAGDFSNWAPLAMERGEHGVWYYFISNYPDRCRYKLLVDGIWISDPKNDQREDDGRGDYVSILKPGPMVEKKGATFIDGHTVEFRIYRPRARFVAVVGDFNNWNPENDILKKDKNGTWRLMKKLSRGTYRYKYIIDGTWTQDIYNERSASDGIEGVCSVIMIP